MQDIELELNPARIKSCCTNFYENDLVAKVLGNNFHPGGEKLTLHLGEKLGLNEKSSVLDVACGPGASSIALAKQFGSSVTGIDLSEKNLKKARENAAAIGLSGKLEFKSSDAESLEFDDNEFDAVICECALCTFPNKRTAVNEMHRILKPGGMVGITDVVIKYELPDKLKNILFQVACIADALPTEEYQELLKTSGFSSIQFEDHSYAIQEILNRTGNLIRGWEFINKISDFDLENTIGITVTPNDARELLKLGYEELEKGNIGYGLFIGKLIK